MYKIKKEYKAIEIIQYLPVEFEGEMSISLASASQEELEHIYEVVGATKHIERIGEKPVNKITENVEEKAEDNEVIEFVNDEMTIKEIKAYADENEIVVECTRKNDIIDEVNSKMNA